MVNVDLTEDVPRATVDVPDVLAKAIFLARIP